MSPNKHAHLARVSIPLASRAGKAPPPRDAKSTKRTARQTSPRYRRHLRKSVSLQKLSRELLKNVPLHQRYSCQKTEIGAAGQSRMWADSLKKTAHAKTARGKATSRAFSPSRTQRLAILTSRAVQDVCCCFLPLRARGRGHARDCSGAAEAWCVSPLATPPASGSRPDARKNPGDRRGRVSGLGFVSRASERVPGAPGEPRTPTNASPRATHAARGPPGVRSVPGDARPDMPRRDAASPSRKRHYWITWCFSTFHRVLFFPARARLGVRRAPL